MAEKYDSQLELAIENDDTYYDENSELYAGYNPNTGRWQLLVRYTGNLALLQEKYQLNIIYLLANYAVVEIEQYDIQDFANEPEVIYIEKPKTMTDQVSFPQYASCISSSIENNYGLNGSGILLSVIDSGIDYSHPEFLRDGKSRILEYWDQTGLSSDSSMVGRIYSNEEINQALEGMGAPIPGDSSGHGTQVTAIAAGTNIGVARACDLIIVKVGSSTYSRFPTTLGILLGIDYSIKKSMELNRSIVINISFGNNYGSHKGDSLLENYINDVSRLAKCTIITGTGNDGISRRYKQLNILNSSYGMLDIVVSEYVTGFNLQLWKNYQDLFDIYVVAPNSETVMFLSEQMDMGNARYRNTMLSGIYGTPNPYNRNQEIFINFSAKNGYVASGQWRILINSKRIVNGIINAYLPVQDSVSGSVEFLVPTDFGTLSIPSTAEGLISVAAYNQNTEDVAYFSGRGYTADNAIKPDLAAPGVDIYTAYPGGQYSFASGTSMAVPFVAGASALLMQWGITDNNDAFLYGEKLKAVLIGGARELTTFREYPNIYVGADGIIVSSL